MVRSASATWSKPTSAAASASGRSSTWNCFTPPPMGTTWETPLTESSRLRMVHSETLRASIIWRSRPVASWARACSSQATERKRISPITEEMGAIVGGGTSAGSCEPTSCSFSFTTCRAM